MPKKKKKEPLVIPEVIHETVYALRHLETGKLLRLQISSNEGGDFCGETSARLDHWSGDDEPFDQDTWYIDSAVAAEYVRQYPTAWYNSGKRCPDHNYEPDELELVEIKREIRTVSKPTKIPTFLEFMSIQYKDKEPAHYEYIKKEYESSRHSRDSWSYNIYELEMMMDEGKWKPEEDQDESNN